MTNHDQGIAPAYAIFAGLCASLVAIGLARFAYTPLIPALIHAHWFAASDVVYLGAANFAGYFVGAVLGRPLASRTSRRFALRAMMLLASVAFIACAFPLSLAWFFAWRFASGFAGAVVMVLVAQTILPLVAPARHGFASGAIFMGIGAGIVASGTLVSVLLQVSLATCWCGLGAVSLALTALTWRAWPAVSKDSTAPAVAPASEAVPAAAALASKVAPAAAAPAFKAVPAAAALASEGAPAVAAPASEAGAVAAALASKAMPAAAALASGGAPAVAAPSKAVPAVAAPASKVAPAPLAVRVLYVEYAAVAVGLVPVAVFLVDFVARGLHQGAGHGARYWILYGAGALCGPVVYGMVADRIGFRNALRFGLLLAGVASLLLAVQPQDGGLAFTLALAGASILLGAFTPGVVSLMIGRLHELLPGDHPAQHAAWSRSTTVFALCQALSGYAYSWLFAQMDAPYRVIYLIAAGAFAVALTADFLAARHSAHPQIRGQVS